MVVNPTISIVMPTYNSGRTLELSLKSIRSQSYPQDKVEILVIDGGSKDTTLEIAKKYNCRIIPNPRVGIMEAEELGFFKAKGKYMVGLAPDEVLENINSLRLKIGAFQKYPRVKSVLPTGYKTPEDYSPINYYVNEFGDPFSFFMYRDSKGYQYLSRDLVNKYDKVNEDQDCVVFSFKRAKQLPLIELWAGGCMVDFEYIRKNFPEVNKNLSLIPLFFYLLNSKNSLLAVTKNDPTVHYSSGSVRKYLKKIRSRVEWNIFKTSTGMGGFTGREKFEPVGNRYKKYMFFPYAFSLVLPFLDSLYLTCTRKKPIYMLHLPMTVYTAWLILYYFILKQLNINHTIKLYGH